MRMRSDDGGDGLWFMIVSVILFIVIAIVVVARCNRSAECEKRGGRYVSRADGWGLGECVQAAPRRTK